MKNTFVFLFFILFLLPYRLKAQDSSSVKKNQVYAEILGNNFYDANSNISFVSLNYARKIFSDYNHNSFILSLGASAFKSKYIDTVPAQWVDHTTTVFTIPMGFLWRMKYKRNGFWLGLYYTSAFGKQMYTGTVGHNTIYYLKDYSFQLSPNLSYQFQSKSENFFCRISFTPKLNAGLFLNEYGDRYAIFPIWGGISIGGGW